jgi:predicted neuraminidase
MATSLLILAALAQTATAGEPVYRDLFAREDIHNHSSCVVECPNGDLFAVWYRGTGERKADDVQIFGARLRKGAEQWEERFLLADTPGYPDCNPAVFVSPGAKDLWLFYPTILDHNWEGALLKYAVSDDYQGEGSPAWKKEGVFHVTPEGLGEDIDKALAKLDTVAFPFPKKLLDEAKERGHQEIYQRLGWMPRVRAIVLKSGRWMLPLYTDTFSASLVAYSDDQGKTWKFSNAMLGFGNIQPSLVEKEDGTVVAFMRDNGPPKQVAVAESADGGATWGEVRRIEVVNPGAGIEVTKLKSGKWALIYNDSILGRHTLALAVSEDEGETWKRTRYLERAAPKTESFHYPSMFQAEDGTIHATYTHGGRPEGSTIRHAEFTEEWLLTPDGIAAPEEAEPPSK